MPLPFTPNRGNARVVGVCPRQYEVLLLNIGLRTVDRLRREISFVHNIFIFAGVCMRSERAKKNLIKMTRYSYPGGKSISSLSLSLSLAVSRRRRPRPRSRSCPPHRFSTTPTARPLAKPIPRPTDALPHALPMPKTPRFVLRTVSCRTIPAVCHRRNRHVVFFF
jgi:hypothetical protein